MEQLKKIEVKAKPTQTTSEKLMPIPTEAKPESKLKRFWKILDGNKTIIGSITLTVISVVPIPEPYKTTIRESLDEILIEKDYQAASERVAILVDGLVDIPGIDDAMEAQLFKTVLSLAAQLLAKIGTDKD